MPKKGGKFRINEDIRIRQVRLVDKDGEMVGVVPIEEAQASAKEADMDLVEVSPNADPPVCKILDYGKFKYEEKKREHEAKKKQRGGDFKEIRLRPKTDTHDRNIKLDRARRFLREGNRVQVTLMFRGREMQHISRGSEILNAVAKELEDVAKIERYANRDGRRMHMSLMPKPGLKPPPKKAEKEEKPGKEAEPEKKPQKEAEAEKKPEKEDEGEKAKEPVKVDGNPAASEADPDEAAPEAAGPAE
ncbi:MAG: translation initiation factor IF-3 [Planctomycetota bacterium]|jgi:translation initiation factor IF-3